MFQGVEKNEHLTRHGFEVDGQGVVLLHDVSVIHLDQGVAQIFGRCELQEIVDFTDTGLCETERWRQGG